MNVPYVVIPFAMNVGQVASFVFFGSLTASNIFMVAALICWSLPLLVRRLNFLSTIVKI